MLKTFINRNVVNKFWVIGGRKSSKITLDYITAHVAVLDVKI